MYSDGRNASRGNVTSQRSSDGYACENRLTDEYKVKEKRLIEVERKIAWAKSLRVRNKQSLGEFQKRARSLKVAVGGADALLDANGSWGIIYGLSRTGLGRTMGESSDRMGRRKMNKDGARYGQIHRCMNIHLV